VQTQTNILSLSDFDIYDKTIGMEAKASRLLRINMG